MPDSGTMPLVAASILSVSVGDVKVRQVRLPKNDPKQVRTPFFRLSTVSVFSLLTVNVREFTF